MKRHILLYLSLLLMPFTLQAQKSAYLSQIRVTDCQVQKIASGQIHLQLTLHFDSLQLGSQHALYIVPVLISADGTQQQAFQASSYMASNATRYGNGQRCSAGRHLHNPATSFTSIRRRTPFR